MAPEYLVALPIDDMRVGSEYPPGIPIPLHCTLMHWFRHKPHPIELDNLLYVLADGVSQGSIEFISRAPALFGPKNDVPVHVLWRNERLLLLHTELLISLAHADSLPEERRWVGAGYRPHVATVDRPFSPGQRHSPSELVLIRRGEDMVKEVSERFPFRQNAN